MEEGLPQSEPHHLGGGVNRDDASFHLGEENTVLVKHKLVNKRAESHTAHVFRHYAWYLNSLSMHKYLSVFTTMTSLQF